MSIYKKQPKTFGEAMDRKEESISRFQDSKELSIAVASSMRDAVLVAVENPKFKEMSEKEKEEYITKWRAWFFRRYNVNETTKELTAPF